MKVVCTLLMMAFLCSCTPGGMSAILSTGPQAGVTTIDINLSAHQPSQTPAGTSGGYAPAITTVAVGSAIRFVNSDSFAHTATAIPGTGTFPAGSPFTASAQTQSGSEVSTSWSTGTLQAGAASQIITIDTPGTYLFGCFYHYGAPMRGEIVAQ